MEEARDGRDWAERVIREERELEGNRLRATLPDFGSFEGNNSHVTRNYLDNRVRSNIHAHCLTTCMK